MKRKEKNPTKPVPNYLVDGVLVRLAPSLQAVYETIAAKDGAVAEVDQICGELGITPRNLQVSVNRLNTVLSNNGLPPLVNRRKTDSFPGGYSLMNTSTDQPIARNIADRWVTTTSDPFSVLPRRSKLR